jgi:hypothetical protein
MNVCKIMTDCIEITEYTEMTVCTYIYGDECAHRNVSVYLCGDECVHRDDSPYRHKDECAHRDDSPYIKMSVRIEMTVRIDIKT